MKILNSIWILVLVVACGCAHTHGTVGAESYRSVTVPLVPLVGSERIDSIELVLNAANFSAINRLPEGWTAQITGPIGLTYTLIAQGSPKGAALWNHRYLENFVTINIKEPLNFSIKGKLVVSASDKKRTVVLNSSDFDLKPAK